MDEKKLKLSDEYARSIFSGLGYGDETPDHIVEAYLKFKKVKDFLQAGRLSPEGFAFVVCLAELSEAPATTPRKRQSKKTPVKKEKLEPSETTQKVDVEEADMTNSPFGE